MKKTLKRGFMIGVTGMSVFLTPIPVSAAESGTMTYTEWKEVKDNGSLQGMCVDSNNNIYVACLNKSQVQIYKYSQNKTKSKVIDSSELGHANDMTYCTADGYIYVVTGGDKSINPKYDVIAFNPKKKSNGSYAVARRYKVKIDNDAPSGIAYDSKNNVFYLKKGKQVFVGNFKDGKFQKISAFKVENDDYINQGIAVYNGKMYVPLWDEKQGKGKSSVIKVYNVIKNSNKSYSCKFAFATRHYDNADKNNKFEIEALDFTTSGQMYFAANGKEKTKAVYKGNYTIMVSKPNDLNIELVPFYSA